VDEFKSAEAKISSLKRKVSDLALVFLGNYMVELKNRLLSELFYFHTQLDDKPDTLPIKKPRNIELLQQEARSSQASSLTGSRGPSPSQSEVRKLQIK